MGWLLDKFCRWKTFDKWSRTKFYQSSVVLIFFPVGSEKRSIHILVLVLICGPGGSCGVPRRILLKKKWHIFFVNSPVQYPSYFSISKLKISLPWEFPHSNAPADLGHSYILYSSLSGKHWGSKSNLKFSCSKVEVSLKQGLKCKARFNIVIGNRNAFIPDFARADSGWGINWL